MTQIEMMEHPRKIRGFCGALFILNERSCLRMNLTPRLQAAAELCRGARRVIDVGCDHAHLCVELVQRGAERAYASDIREGPLQRARETIARCGMEEAVETVLCDGLHGFAPDMADAIVICGMGGDTICHILEEAPWALSGRQLLVLQPMTRAETLRRFLARHGCVIEQERLAREWDRLYCVMAARGGHAPYEVENGGLFSDAMRQELLFSQYLGRQAERCRVALEGRRLAGLDGGEVQKMLAILQREEHQAT